MDVEVEVDWGVPEVPEPADFGDELHSPCQVPEGDVRRGDGGGRH